MTDHRWQFYNPTTATTVRFPLNPAEGALPSMEKVVEATTTTSPSGQPLIFEGRQRPRSFSLSGTIIDESHYNFMVDWFNSSVACQVTDELGNTFSLYLIKFSPKRKNRTNAPWAMDFDAEALVTG